MEKAVSKRRSSRVASSENFKPNLKRKATNPLPISDLSGRRPVLKNLTNQSTGSKKKASDQDHGTKKAPNYLKPTISTQQKCTKKKIDSFHAKSTTKKCAGGPGGIPSGRIKKKSAVSSVSENLYGFEEELENLKPCEISKKTDQDSITVQKQEDFDVASPLRIELVPFRSTIQSTPKPPVNRVLSILKSSLSSPLPQRQTPQTIENKLPQHSKSATPQRTTETSVSCGLLDDELSTSFSHPPRRSYSRQRPVTNFAEFDELSSDEEEKEEGKKREKEENMPEKEEPKRKSEKKKKSRKVTAQDKHFEELAAAMNSQFGQVEDFQLIVE